MDHGNKTKIYIRFVIMSDSNDNQSKSLDRQKSIAKITPNDNKINQ